ncbi:MAG: RnfABCDGE type electron transport complex subunit G [Synergistaceae bacterium]|nr:RnfABCDGE type electron transport complex subunit G [Synergistaceae bacterium]MBQ6971710.1 RnfABCDGE type electron transport complex subunit G [Synergistaceae bacterium]
MSDKVSFNDALRKALHLGGTLFAVTAVTGILLGLVENVTSKAILQAEIAAKNEAYRLVMPAGKTFEDAEVKPDDFVTGVVKAMDESGVVGWCVNVSSKGYGGMVGFVVGITKDGAVKAINILSHSETPGLGAKSTEPEFYTQFNDKDKLPLKVVKGSASNPDEIAAISGATITSNAVTDGVNGAVDYWSKNLKGAE